MDNHPIPQDVTGFQFRLIGDMTVKQFAYLAAAAILGWIAFTLPLPVILKFPLAFVVVGSGIALAFLPIEGRPLDVMVSHFLQALFSPNQYIYQKVGIDLNPYVAPVKAKTANSPTVAVSPAKSQQELQAYLQKLPKKAKNKYDEREMVFFQNLTQSVQPQQASSPSQMTSLLHGLPHIMSMHQQPVSSQQPEPKEEAQQPVQEAPKDKLEKEAEAIKHEIEESKQKEAKVVNTPIQPEVHQHTVELERQLQEMMQQKQQLEKQLFALSQKLQTSQQHAFSPSMAQATPVTQNVRKIPKSMGAQIGLLALPDSPNLITGIIKDPRGNVLPNILIEVKDKDGNPVRAFKTNNLGQFASATPLLNGVYTIEFEDTAGKNKFDLVEIEATGEPLTPLEVTSTDEREQLRKELFGK